MVESHRSSRPGSATPSLLDRRHHTRPGVMKLHESAQRLFGMVDGPHEPPVLLQWSRHRRAGKWDIPRTISGTPLGLRGAQQ
jgi:hypothetical protein